MDGIDVKNFKALREEKEYLSRELAEACRDYIDLKYRYEEVVCGYRFIKEALAQKMVENEEATTIEEATLKIKQDVDLELMKYAQLKLPLVKGDKK